MYTKKHWIPYIKERPLIKEAALPLLALPLVAKLGAGLAAVKGAGAAVAATKLGGAALTAGSAAMKGLNIAGTALMAKDVIDAVKGGATSTTVQEPSNAQVMTGLNTTAPPPNTSTPPGAIS